ncbi:MAG: DUF2996 domain-containing protein [Cyanobium sp. M30B3]|nr:MAG: DUF2996 domain-containing protein [Cyanobium sp. M30B3]
MAGTTATATGEPSLGSSRAGIGPRGNRYRSGCLESGPIKPWGPSLVSDPTPSPTPAPAAEARPAKPAKPPAAEAAPFASFIPDSLIPALAREICSYGGPEPQMRFEQGPMPVVSSPCWMVVGELPGERRFWLCFTRDDISAAKTVAVAEGGAEPSLLESFLIDEKKITQALLVSRLVQRLNGQKWLGPN